MLGSIEFFRKEFNEISHLNNGPNISLHITRSPGMTTTVRQVDPAHAAIFVPVGVLGRIQIAHKLLLSCWNREGKPVRIVHSIMDRPVERCVPNGLTALLGEFPDENTWWNAIDSLDAEIKLDQAFAPDIAELNHLSLSLLLNHEFAHVIRHHYELRERVRSGQLTFEINSGTERKLGTYEELQRAMENDADSIAAYLTARHLLINIQQNPESNLLSRGFLRLGYSLFTLLALFDPQKQSIFSYGQWSAYPHPLIRLINYQEYFRNCIEQYKLPEKCDDDFWYGIEQCHTALSWIENDIYFRNRFGSAVNDGETIHALRFSETFALSLLRKAEKEQYLASQLDTILKVEYGKFSFPEMVSKKQTG